MARPNDLDTESKRSPLWALITGAALAWALAPSQAGAQAQCPNPPPVTLSPQVPTDVCIPSDFPPNVSGIAFFDDFSWRSFVAMVWPALQGQRGAADPNQKVGATGGPLVFETFKADWELFQANGAAPSPWNSYAAGSNPCGLASVGPADFLLTSFSKFANLGQAGFGKLVGHGFGLRELAAQRFGQGVGQVAGYRQEDDAQGQLQLLRQLDQPSFPVQEPQERQISAA